MMVVRDIVYLGNVFARNLALKHFNNLHKYCHVMKSENIVFLRCCDLAQSF